MQKRLLHCLVSDPLASKQPRHPGSSLPHYTVSAGESKNFALKLNPGVGSFNFLTTSTTLNIASSSTVFKTVQKYRKFNSYISVSILLRQSKWRRKNFKLSKLPDTRTFFPTMQLKHAFKTPGWYDPFSPTGRAWDSTVCQTYTVNHRSLVRTEESVRAAWSLP